MYKGWNKNKIYNQFQSKNKIQNCFTENIKGLNIKPKIKNIRTELKPQYIINFHLGTKLKQIKTFITEIKTITNNQNIKDQNKTP